MSSSFVVGWSTDMSKRVIRNISNKRLLNLSQGRKYPATPIGFDRFSKTRTKRLESLKSGSVSRTKNLIKYLLGNGSRAQRASMPKTYIRLCVLGRDGSHAVKLHFR